MKSLSAAMLTHLAGEVITLATCWKVTLQDGTILGFTDHNQNLLVAGVTYVATVGYSASELQSNDQLSVDNVSLIGNMDGTLIVSDQIRAGRWDYAQVEVFRVNHQDLTMGTIPMRKGRLGETKQGNIVIESELRGQTQFLQQSIGRLYQPTCDTNLYSPVCGVRPDPPVWVHNTNYTANTPHDAATGSLVKPTTPNNCYFLCTFGGSSGGGEPSWNTTIGGSTGDGGVTWKTIQSYKLVGVAVTSVTSQRQWTSSSIVHPDGWFTYGTVTFTTGLNAGYSNEVRSHVAGVITLQLPMPYPVSNGDQYTILAGCDLLYSTCKSAKFDDGTNFQGFPTIPGVDRLATGT
jgi:hypothetical protein